MPTMTFYPDAHPESISVDGEVDVFAAGGLTWAGLVAAAGTSFSDSSNSSRIVNMQGHNTDTDKWIAMQRAIFLFDTSTLLDGATITSAILSLYGISKQDAQGWLPDVNIYSADPVSNIALAASDFQRIDSTPLCDTPITYNGWNPSGYNDFALNAAGLAIISKTGITKFMTRNANYEVAGSSPTWASGQKYAFLACYFAERGSIRRPKLVVTFDTAIPQVTTNPATNLFTSTAALNGTLDDEGVGACACGFDYGTTIAYGSTAESPGTYNTGNSFSIGITGLTPGTLYHFRARANDGFDIGYGSDRTFFLGTVYPSNVLTRVTGIIHRYDRGVYSVELTLGDVTSDFGVPEVDTEVKKSYEPKDEASIFFPEPTTEKDESGGLGFFGILLQWLDIFGVFRR